VNNDAGVEKGVHRMIVNGEVLTDNLIRTEMMNQDNEITVEMG
jgi:hypothetical protein